MRICRKYINHLNIISIVEILDICKQEAIELDHAARRTISSERADVVYVEFQDTVQNQ
jgi:hypothetical protein